MDKKIQKGTIVQVIGAVADIFFPGDFPPPIYNALEVKDTDYKGNLVFEVAAHLGDGKVRAIALGATDGLKRGMTIADTGGPISVPVGKQALGRIFNVIGDVIDGLGECKTTKRLPIHRSAPELTEQNPKQEILETGLK